ncbi:hypothetical protein UA08_06094 [Talaromyces atroroseus]|uniref:C3H1-type domain-containing protein n=1 Tax=Talaromyces atroroseus TaxID=1441469 RepID=A0A225AJH4_TALAT|nr:hypothetical protein UA08_06094 [Talaromyces atroroseus]OKL58404.1 hypothetical protein UA08_06094 [Talaromyces atroroseus]
MTEEQELLAKIGQLAGQINQHKNQRLQSQSPASTSYNARHPRAGWAPYRARGSQRRPVSHRNRTLILNNNSAASSSDASKTPALSDATETVTPPPGSNGWVAKRDRHMQLINSSIYDKEAQARTRAIAETEKTKREKRAQAEEAKVMRYAQGVRSAPTSHIPGRDAVTNQPSSYQIYIHDAPFQVVRGGSKLIRQSNNPKNANATPKKVVVGGVTFVRSKKGNLHRLGAVVAKRSPVCVHFLRGRCSNPECRYTHVRVTPGAPVCRAFGILGYCEKGENCPDRHVYECPDYANTGSCKKKKCTLPHIDRAGQIRKAAAATTTKSGMALAEGDADEEDVSSEEEEEYDEIDSDDVDSDELDSDDDEPMVEFIEGGTDDKELSGQQDFVHF